MRTPPAPSGVARDDASPPRRRRRWRRVLAISVVVVLAITGVLTAAFQFGVPWSMGDRDSDHTFANDQGTMHYQVHLPPEQVGEEPLPVMMALHGCGMTGFGWNSMKLSTQFNELADREGFIVVYPTQRIFQSAANCWNADDPREQHRNAGDPALLAGVARQVVEQFDGDPSQVHVSGASSGAGTAVILGVTYPDVFATVTSVAGAEYSLNQVGHNGPDPAPTAYTARQAWAQMGDRARHVPLLIVQGEEDTVTPPKLATRLVEHWTQVNDLVDDGQLNDSLGLVSVSTQAPAVTGTHPYEHTTYARPDGATLIETYRVDGMGHAWPGPHGDGLYTDHAGPDAAAISWEFAQRHPLR